MTTTFCPVCGKPLDGSQPFQRLDGWPACAFPCSVAWRNEHYEYRERVTEGVSALNARIRDAAIRGTDVIVYTRGHTENGMKYPVSYPLVRVELETRNPLE